MTPRQYLKELCVEVPTSFAAAEFTTFMAGARTVLLNPKGAEWSEFAGASNLMGWRFRNAVDSFDEYANSWEKYGVACDHEELYKRDRALFEFFTAGVSCIEATCYGLYALASHVKVLGLPFGPKEQKAAYPRQVKDALKSVAPSSTLVAALETMLAAPEWTSWLDFRNRTSHRSNLPQIIYGIVGPGTLPHSPAVNVGATSSTSAFAAELDDLRQRLEWLGSTQQALFVGATALIP